MVLWTVSHYKQEFNLLSPFSRPFYFGRSLEPLYQPSSNRLDLFPFFHREINNVELAFLAQSLLRHRQVHQRKVSAKNFCHPLFLEERADGVVLLAATRGQSDFCSDGQIEPTRKRLRQSDRIRQGDKIQRLIKIGFGADELMIANRAIGK